MFRWGSILKTIELGFWWNHNLTGYIYSRERTVQNCPVVQRENSKQLQRSKRQLGYPGTWPMTRTRESGNMMWNLLVASHDRQGQTMGSLCSSDSNCRRIEKLAHWVRKNYRIFYTPVSPWVGASAKLRAELETARSRFYRSRILRINHRFPAFTKIIQTLQTTPEPLKNHKT